MHLNMYSGQRTRQGTVETSVISNKKTSQCNSDCSGSHDVWLRVPKGVHTKRDRLNGLQLQSYIEFDTEKCTGEYQKSVGCHGFYENTLSLFMF